MFMKSQLYSSALFGLNDIRIREGCVWIFKVQNVAIEGGEIADQRKPGSSGRGGANWLRSTQNLPSGKKVLWTCGFFCESAW